MNKKLLLSIASIMCYTTCFCQNKTDLKCMAYLSANKDTLAIVKNIVGNEIFKTWEMACKYTRKTSIFKPGNLEMDYWETNETKIAIGKKDTIIPPRIIIMVDAISPSK